MIVCQSASVVSRQWMESQFSNGRNSYALRVARVHPDDDSIDRWVVYHYRYDPDRGERRNVAVAAYDNPSEFHGDIEERAAEIRARKEGGEAAETAEHISGQMHAAGYRRLQRNARLLRRAIEHGVALAHVEDLDLPPNVGVIRAERLGW
jgi:hypothetical protein